MPKVLFVSRLLEDGRYICHARVGFATAREQREFLERNRPPNPYGWHVGITSSPRRGYNGKPVYQVDIHLSKPFPSAEPPVFRIREPEPEGHDSGDTSAEEQQDVGATRETLSWEQRQRFRQETREILRQLGVADLGHWK